jgi:hypothetical protein
MFLDSFPLHEQDSRPSRSVRESVAPETGKSRSTWPFIVADKGFNVQPASPDSLAGMPPVPAFAFSTPDTGSFVT